MQLDGIRKKVFLDRYSLKDEKGFATETTPEETWKRVARGIAAIEKKENRAYWRKEFYRVMEDFKFVPGGRILSGAGTDYQVTYFNCFVIPNPKDSRHGILQSLGQLIEIQARSGGVGLNLSSLRPRGARVKKVNGTSSGAVNWAELFSVATHDIVQQGGSRRGATMLMMWDWHPDVEEFITVKQDLTKISGANLSVCISDGFMDAVKNDRNWDLIFPDLNDPEYDEKWNGEIDEWKALGKKVKIYKTVKARYLWDLICTAAWRSAEPGLHFLERSNKRSNTWYFEKLIATNPSLRAGTRVLTKEGIFPIEKLEGKKFLVKNLDGKWSEAECFLSGKDKPLYKITLNNGREIFATAEHKWPVLSVGGGFGKVTTDKLQSGNILSFPKADDLEFTVEKPLLRSEGFMLGWLYGDGWISERGSSLFNQQVSLDKEVAFTGKNNVRNFSLQPVGNDLHTVIPRQGTMHNAAMGLPKNSTNFLNSKMVFGFLFSEEDKVLAGPILNEINKLKREKSTLTRARDNTYTIQSTAVEFAQNLAIRFGVDKKTKGLPITVWQSGSEFIKGFVDGLISSDGFIAKNASRIIFTTKHKKIAEDFSALLSFYGIKSNIRRSEATEVKFPNQKSYAKIYERYDVSIDGYHAVRFGKIFPLSHPRKQQNLQRIVDEYKQSRALPDDELIRIRSVEKTDMQEDVWDISVNDDTHCFYIDHCITGNCGEQPLGAWAVCNLGAMNLSAYVRDCEPDKAGWFDFEQFGKDVQVAMRFMDNVIDSTYYFYKENEQVAKDIRRTGLGIMGLGDALIKMHLRYGREESLPMIEKIFKALRDNAYEASSNIAKEKGSFPKFEKAKYMEGYHIKALPKQLQKKITEQGIRNAVLLTIAPTGTTSTIAGASSGVEPVYEFSYKMRWRDEGNKGWREDNVYHPLYSEWLKEHPNEEKPDYFVGANDLTPLEHAKVQAVAQKYIDSSISKTVNAPNSHTVEDVKTLYMAAYDMGMKGITYMRDGSRVGVLTRVDEKKDAQAGSAQGEKKEEKPAIPATPRASRPLMLEGTTYKAETPIGKMYVTINHDENNQPFEVFINTGKSGSDVMAMVDALGRMISFVLRIHSPVPPRERMREIVSGLAGIGGARSVGFGENRVRSLPDAVAKVLAKHYNFRVNGKVEDKVVVEKPSELTANSASNGHINGMLTNGQSNVHVKGQMTLEGTLQPDTPQQQLPLPAQDLSGANTSLFDICPECGTGSFAYEEGCRKCYSCGYSEC